MNDVLNNPEPKIEEFEDLDQYVVAVATWNREQGRRDYEIALRKKLENCGPEVAQVFAELEIDPVPPPSPFDWSKFGARKIQEGPVTPPSPNPWSVTELILGPLHTGIQEAKRSNPEKMARIRRCVDSDVDALNRMLKHAGLQTSINEAVVQDYPLSFVLEDGCGEVRGGLFGSISYVSTFLVCPVAEKSRDPLEDYAALVDAVEAEMKHQGIRHATIWISVPVELRESASRLSEIGFERFGYQEATRMDTWVATYVSGQSLNAGSSA